MLNQTHTFDGTTYTITESPVYGLVVSVTDPYLPGATLELVTRDGMDLNKNATVNAAAMIRAGHGSWICDRMAYVFSLAARRIVREYATA